MAFACPVCKPAVSLASAGEEGREEVYSWTQTAEAALRENAPATTTRKIKWVQRNPRVPPKSLPCTGLSCNEIQCEFNQRAVIWHIQEGISPQGGGLATSVPMKHSFREDSASKLSP